MASSGTASAGTDSSSNGQKGYVSDANAQNKAAARTNGQTRDNNTQPTNTETGRVDTVTGRTDRPTTASSGSNTTQDITEPPTTAGSNSTGNTIYAQNQAGTPGSSNMTEQNAENAAVSATGGQGTDTDTDSAGQGPREYTDVSQAFTENLGIEPSGLPEEGGVEFNDTTFPIPQIVFPDRIETSSNTAELPLTIINEAAEPTEIQLKSLSIGSDGKIQKQQLENIIVRIPPEGKSELTIRIALPDSLRREGQHRTDIRLDLAQQDKTFSQAAVILLTIKPTFIQSLLRGNLLWILLAALVFILILLLIIFVLRRRASEPVKYAARMVGQQSDLRQQSNPTQQTDFNRNQREALTASQTKYYPEQLANRTDPRDTLNTFSSQTAAATAVTKTETAAQFDHLAQERSRATEGRFALLNSAEGHLNRRPGLNHGYYSGRVSTKPSQSGMTELFVYNQTTLIGKRNIHVMKAGTRLSIGGSKSDDFLIFLVPFPANLAQVQYDGNDYRVSILKPEYFPYETSNTIYPCIGRDITAVSKKGYPVTFTFRGYEDPMIRLNTILTSTNPEPVPSG